MWCGSYIPALMGAAEQADAALAENAVDHRELAQISEVADELGKAGRFSPRL
jgi:hypothetical protein